MKLILSMIFLIAAVADSTALENMSHYTVDGITSGNFFWCVLAAYIGYAGKLWWSIDYAVKVDPRTPPVFDKSYFWSNNFKSLLRDFFSIPLVVLFYPQLADFILTHLRDYGLVPDAIGHFFDKYKTTTIFTSLFVGILFKMGVSKLREIKWRKKKSANSKSPLG